jgi:rhodanese-related sulfurtransferase
MTLTVQDLIADALTKVCEIDADRMLSLRASGVPVIDVREPAEYGSGHVPGAVNIPRGLLEFEIDGHPAVNCRKDPALSHRDEPVVLYCRSGGRSALAAEALQRLGFRNPLSLAGGFAGWTSAGRAIEAGVAQ